ncbi:MAG: rRNA adenine methyltransferase [Chloroflexi bacterium]|nr:MAG: rRNA adenine methyltransferase [Chloroflexota bacterium]
MGAQVRTIVTRNSLDSWEALWAPYDETTYRDALAFIRPEDTVLDIGAGDLRFARRAAAVARRVYAVEIQPALLHHQPPLPPNLLVICADARQIPWPRDITVGVLLMRHCAHVGLYTRRLREIGCRRLVTNARWRMGVEEMLLEPRMPWSAVRIGWYACLCGAVGFVPGPPSAVTPAVMETITEVENCPACQPFPG